MESNYFFLFFYIQVEEFPGLHIHSKELNENFPRMFITIRFMIIWMDVTRMNSDSSKPSRYFIM